MRDSEDLLANAQTRLGNLDTRIAELEAAKKAEVVHVRWDRSLRDHKESLDSYHPDGWVWDRVYPDVHTPSRPDLPPGAQWPPVIRLTMVPGGNHLPAETPYEPGDFDAVSGVLRAPLVAEQPSRRSIGFLNVRGRQDPQAATSPPAGIPASRRCSRRPTSRSAASPAVPTSESRPPPRTSRS